MTGTSTLRQVLLYPGEDGYWVAECPSLPGCISQGASNEPLSQLVVPDHRELDRGALRAINRQAALSVDEFCRLL